MRAMCLLLMLISLGACNSSERAALDAGQPCLLEPLERADASPQYLTDRALEARLTREGQKLIEAGKTIALEKLQDQLSRKEATLTLPPTSRGKLTAAEIYRDRRATVLMVGTLYKCEKCNNWHSGTAGGVALTEDGVFLTNHHVVKKTHGKDQHKVIMTDAGKVYPVKEVLAADERNDWALCRADVGSDKLKAAALSSDAPVGSTATVISHPESRYFTLTQGLVSRYANVQLPSAVGQRMTITADYARGSSGCPVFNDAGDVIGIVSTTQSVYYTVDREQQKNLQMVFKDCIPAEVILAKIRK